MGRTSLAMQVVLVAVLVLEHLPPALSSKVSLVVHVCTATRMRDAACQHWSRTMQ
jgi:hypothetical protein